MYGPMQQLGQGNAHLIAVPSPGCMCGILQQQQPVPKAGLAEGRPPRPVQVLHGQALLHDAMPVKSIHMLAHAILRKLTGR